MSLLDDAKKTIKTAQKKAEIVQKEYEQNLEKSGGDVLKAGFKTVQPYAERKYNEAKENYQEAKNTIKNPQPIENKVFKNVYSTADKTLANANQKLKENVPIYNKATKIPQTVQNIYDTGLSNSEELAKQGGAYGLINSIGKVGYDLTYPIAHPMQTVEGLGNMITDPQGTGGQLADVVVNYIDPANDFQNIQADPAFIPRTAGEFILGGKGLKSTHKTVTPQIPKTEIPVVNAKSLPVQPKVVAPKTKIPTVNGDKYAMAGRYQQVLPTHPLEANPSMGGFESVKKQVLPEEVPLSTEKISSIIDPLPETDTTLVQYLKGEIPLEELHKETLPYLMNEYSKTTGLPIEDVISDFNNTLAIRNRMQSRGSYDPAKNRISVRTRGRGESYSEHSANPNYIDNIYDTVTHEFAHKLQNNLADWEAIGALSDEGRNFANKYNLTLQDRPSENLSHAVSASGLPKINITPERVGIYGDYYLNPYDVADMHPIVQNSIRDYIINRDMPSVDPMTRDINNTLTQILNKKGIEYQPNIKGLEFEEAPEWLR